MQNTNYLGLSKTAWVRCSSGVSLIWPKDKLTRFEVARLLGARSLQISLGAPVLVKTEESSAIKIAKEEFKQGLIPITVKRRLPTNAEVVVEIRKAIENWITEHNGEI